MENIYEKEKKIYVYIYIYMYVLRVFHIFSLVCLNLFCHILSTEDNSLFSGGFRPHLELLGHDGHVHVPTFGPISYVSVPKRMF